MCALEVVVCGGSGGSVVFFNCSAVYSVVAIVVEVCGGVVGTEIFGGDVVEVEV